MGLVFRIKNRASNEPTTQGDPMSMYPRLDYARFTPTTLDIEESLIVQVLKNSKGERTMSDEDVKLALLSLFSTCKFQ
jgi:hypothetical protein